MFTGLIEETGIVSAVVGANEGRRVVVTTSLQLDDTSIGDSIAVDGVCLTVVQLEREGMRWRAAFDVGPETLKVSTFAERLRVSRRVHLERAMKVGARLGGHIVSGHVDGVGRLRVRRPTGEALVLVFHAPDEVKQLCIPKGSIAIDGASLTINGVDDDGFDVCLIPHTLEKTHLSELQVGDAVNLESDVVGKYVRRLLGPFVAGRPGVDEALLRRSGFL
jgi:riboflavin synthase